MQSTLCPLCRFDERNVSMQYAEGDWRCVTCGLVVTPKSKDLLAEVFRSLHRAAATTIVFQTMLENECPRIAKLAPKVGSDRLLLLFEDIKNTSQRYEKILVDHIPVDCFADPDVRYRNY